MTDDFPKLDNCIDLYVSAYRSFGMEAFDAEQLDPDWVDGRREEMLDFAVAYGLLERAKEEYSVRIAPDASADRWETLAIDRVQTVQQAVADRSGDTGVARQGNQDEADDASDEHVIHRDGRRYASVVVRDTDDFDSVATNVATAMRTSGTDGVVFRSVGELADRVQQFADRLCDADSVAGEQLSEPLQKVGSDVEGEDKDSLEFRLFLKPR